MRPLACACAAALAAALLLGGSTRGGVATAALQLAALPLFALAVADLKRLLRGRPGLAALLALIVLIPVLQLIPLPPALWTLAPGRAAVIETYRAAGVELPAAPLSVSPWATLRTALALLPPLAIFLGVLGSDAAERRLYWRLAIGVAAASIVLEVAQIIDGPASALRFYAPSDPESAPGLFANRNHAAALLYCALPIAAALSIAESPRWPRLSLVALGGFYLAAGLGLMMTGSRAALLLGLLAVALSIGVILRERAVASLGRRLFWGLGGAVALATLALAPAFGLEHILERFSGEETGPGGRLTMARLAFKAALGFFPFGAGLGAFSRVYPLFQTRETIAPAIINHAHNDALEIVVEAGALGLGALIGALAYIARCVRAAPPAPNPALLAERRAAAIMVTLLCLHSLFDYPLRMPALAALFALAAGTLCRAAPATAR